MAVHTWLRDEPPAPPRLVHLGLGAFARAHAVRYTDLANAVGVPAERWDVVGFTGRSARVAAALAQQDGRYTLLVRSPDGDKASVVDALSAMYDGADGTAWRDYLARPEVGVVTLTVTEAGYRRGANGGLDVADPEVAADLRWLTSARPSGGASAAVTAPGRLVDGLRARRAAVGGPVAVVSCDNLSDNGRLLARVVGELTEHVDPELARWIDSNVSFVSTMVDRITPATTAADREEVCALTGRDDAAPVVTEPFSEWVVQGDFPAGRPAWDAVGVRFIEDLEPYERRKLWLLNAGHSLLAYEGLALGLTTVAEAFAEPGLRASLEELWAGAREVLPLPRAEVDAATADLRARFAKARIEHRLDQIARDGSQKLPVRVLAVARARRGAGLPVGAAGAGAGAAWVRHLLERDGAATDAGAVPLTERLLGAKPSEHARVVVEAFAPDLARSDLVEAVSAQLHATIP